MSVLSCDVVFNNHRHSFCAALSLGLPNLSNRVDSLMAAFYPYGSVLCFAGGHRLD